MNYHGLFTRTLLSSATLVVLLLLSSTTCPSHAMTQETVGRLLEETQEFLADGMARIEDDTLTRAIQVLQTEVAGLVSLRHQLERQENSIERLVAQANAKQVEGLISRLNETFAKEMALRKLTETEGNTEKDDDTFVTRQELQEKFNAKTLLAESEYQLSEWILRLVQIELEDYKQNILSPTTENSHDQGGAGASVVSSSGGGCAPITEVVQDVQAALTRFSQDGMGRFDHAQGGDIVHSLTSSTYIPPPTEQELLGNVWWRKYIPEDWEQWLLPAGWEYWNVGIPSFVYHSLVSASQFFLVVTESSISHTYSACQNVKGAKTSPPETILEKKVVPGSCWPMEGSQGQVTIRLPYPIQVESFSLDHVSWNIVPEGAYKSAPKKLKVLVYPPCLEPEDCGALGFDGNDPMEVAQMNFEIDGPSVQTFDSIFVPSSAVQGIAAAAAENELGTEPEEGASCSNEAAACSAPPKIDVAAVTVKILENHGNPDFTCLYRFRVHGEQVL